MRIRVLSYNVSWATQINKIAGSEADFVEQCRKSYKNGGKECTKQAILNISTLKALDLICLQEVSSKIEQKIIKAQPSVKNFIRGTVGVSTVSTIWNPDVFGDLMDNVTVNLVKDGSDFRPCLICLFKRKDQYYIIINLHAPWGYKKTIDNSSKIIREAINSIPLLKEKFFSNDAKIIVCGDFNDANTVLNKNNPLTISNRSKSVKLRYNKNKEKARKTLKSCCWHDKRNKYGYFTDTGDYILVNKNIKQISIKIPDIFYKRGPLNRLLSDHPQLNQLFLCRFKFAIKINYCI